MYLLLHHPAFKVHYPEPGKVSYAYTLSTQEAEAAGW